jgi:hypothetical protein
VVKTHGFPNVAVRHAVTVSEQEGVGINMWQDPLETSAVLGGLAGVQKGDGPFFLAAAVMVFDLRPGAELGVTSLVFHW